MFKIKRNKALIKEYLGPVFATTLLIYLSNGEFSLTHMSAMFRVVFMITIIFFLGILKKDKEFYIQKNTILFAITIILLQMIPMIFYGIDVNSEFFLMLSVFSALLFCSVIPFSEFIHSYRVIIYWISIISVMLFIIVYILPSLVSAIPSFILSPTKWDNTYTVFGTFVVRNILQYTYYRNFGIFSEPGQFQIFLCIGLFIELFYAKKIKWRNIFWILIALVTCNSTNGFLVAGLIFIAYLFNTRGNELKEKKKERRLLAFSLLFSLIIILILNREFFETTFLATIEKIEGLFIDYSFSDTGTGLERRRAFDTALAIYIEHPIVGLGYSGMRTYVNDLSSTGFIMTTSPLNWFARYGTLYGLLVNFAYIFFFVSAPYKKISRLVICLAMILLISAQAVTSDMFIWVIIFYGVQLFWERYNFSITKIPINTKTL